MTRDSLGGILRDTTPVSVEAKAQVFNLSIEERNRREACIKNRDFFYDRTKQYVVRINNDVDAIVLNLTAPIIKKKISLLYSRELQREFVGPAESISFLDKLYKKIKIDRFLRNVDLASELTGTGLIFVGVDDNGETYLRLYDAADFSVIENEYNQEDIDALSIVTVKEALIKSGKSEEIQRYLDTQIWTDEHIAHYKDGKRAEFTTNDLGFIPFVAFKGEEVYNQFLGHAPANSIVSLNSDINQQLSNISYMIKMQAGSPIVITGFERGEGITMNPGHALSLPAGATASVLNQNPKITDSLDVIKWIEEKIYETSSIPKVSIVGDSEASSGKELQIKWSPIINVFKEKSSRYENYELNLANMILAVNDYPLIEEIKVRYPEESILPLSDDLDDIETKLNLGLTTPIDLITADNPTLSEQEAEAEVRANIDFNKSIKLEQPQVGKLTQEG